MKKKEVILLVIILGVLLVGAYLIDPSRRSATASDVPIPGPKAEYSCYANMFNPATVTDVEGTVGAIAENPKFPPVMRMELKTTKGMVSVLISPEFYLKGKNFTVKVGDRIALHGSEISYEGHNILVAVTMKKNGKSIAFRDDKGSLLWTKSGCEK